MCRIKPLVRQNVIFTDNVSADLHVIRSLILVFAKDTSPANGVPQGFQSQGVLGLGPSTTSAILFAVGDITANPVLNNIFQQNSTSQNYITLFLDRDQDPASRSVGQLTISETLPDYASIVQQTKLPVAALASRTMAFATPQFFLTFTDLDGILGSDGQSIISTQSTFPGVPNGTLSVTFDSSSAMTCQCFCSLSLPLVGSA